MVAEFMNEYVALYIVAGFGAFYNEFRRHAWL